MRAISSLAVGLILCVLTWGASSAAAGGLSMIAGGPAADGVALAGSPYRYVAIPPSRAGDPTVVERIARHGGEVSRWWSLPGRYYLTAPAYDLVGSGLSADERTLVLTHLESERLGPPRRTRLALLDPGALAWPGADQWLFLPTGRGEGRALADIAAAFAPGRRAAAFPQIEGWCCSAAR